jgi:hypothetical protein
MKVDDSCDWISLQNPGNGCLIILVPVACCTLYSNSEVGRSKLAFLALLLSSSFMLLG